MKILAIETSCDETSAAVLEGRKDKINILANVISSQIKIHKKYGGVVPEIAARNHIKNVIPVVDKALQKAFGVKIGHGLKNNFSEEIDLVAITGGPGLMSSLLIGEQTAEIFAFAWKKPLININHIEGHIYANWLEPDSESQFPNLKPQFPALTLVVSGGHTQLVLMRNHLKYKTIGQTCDDAAGEAFDKTAKILGLGYPGGPIISKMAEEYGREKNRILSSKIHLPRPMIANDDLNFSFSGLKTAVLYLVREMESRVEPRGPFVKGGLGKFHSEERENKLSKFRLSQETIAGICFEFQQAVIDVLVRKTIKAASKYRVKSILLAGGVAANKELKRQMEEKIGHELENVSFHAPQPIFCTDNAAMVGAAAYYRVTTKPEILKKKTKIKVDPNWEL